MLRTLRAAILLTRPAQWVKNVFVFGALVFGSQRDNPTAILLACAAFAVFCLLSGAVYAVNDVLDYRDDARHPTKKNRPVASGALSPAAALIVALVLAVAGGAVAHHMTRAFFATAMAYVGLNLFYSLWGKKRVLLDVILIAIGFVLRALAGGEAIGVEVSAWLVICTFTLCLFLGFGKRRCEQAVIGDPDRAQLHRATLAGYTPDLLNQLLAVTGGLAVITFLLYTLDPATEPNSMVFTTPLVFYAIFRYAMVIERGVLTGPTDVLIRDRPFLLTAVAWVLVVLLLVFQGDLIDRYLPKLRYPGTPAAAVGIGP